MHALVHLYFRNVSDFAKIFYFVCIARCKSIVYYTWCLPFEEYYRYLLSVLVPTDLKKQTAFSYAL